jgi:hypothetical protein
MATGEFLLITNGDNYYSPRFFEFAFEAIDSQLLDIVIWDMVHSHSKPGRTQNPANCPFSVYPVRYYIDIGSLMVKSSIAKQTGFRDKSFAGDATFLEDVLNLPSARLRIGKIQKTLMMHN